MGEVSRACSSAGAVSKRKVRALQPCVHLRRMSGPLLCPERGLPGAGSVLPSGGIESMDEIDLKLLSAVQDGFPIAPRPFRDLGEAMGLEEDEVISRLAELQKDGLVRRIGPILDLRRMGRSGILAALAVPLGQADGVADVVSGYPEVSHNYLRPDDSGYNL